MNNSIKVIIYDNEGNCLLNDNVTSSFVGFQAGETFWFGSSSNPTWAKVIKITYGLDTESKCFVIEIIVERTEKSTTKVASSIKEFSKIVDYGVIKIDDDKPTWQSGDKRISVSGTSVDKQSGNLINFSATYSVGTEFKIQKKDTLEPGKEITFESETSVLSCVLMGLKTHAPINSFWFANFKIIEKIK